MLLRVKRYTKVIAENNPEVLQKRLGLFFILGDFPDSPILSIPIGKRIYIEPCLECKRFKMLSRWVQDDPETTDVARRMDQVSSYQAYCCLSVDGKPRKLLKMPMHCPFFELK